MVASLAHVPPYSAQRWLRGYRYPRGGESIHRPPVNAGATTGASFLDLIDLVYIREFIQNGVALSTLRKVLDEVEELTKVRHFATQKFFTLDRALFMELEGQAADPQLIKLLSGKKLVLLKEHVKTLSAQIEFQSAGAALALRWFPEGRGRRIVVDPEFGFGQPVLHGHNIKTSVIADFFQGEGADAKGTAKWFGVKEMEVRAAVRFERSLKAAA
jgi:uncharacterized protein (DUF433 family)